MLRRDVKCFAFSIMISKKHLFIFSIKLQIFYKLYWDDEKDIEDAKEKQNALKACFSMN